MRGQQNINIVYSTAKFSRNFRVTLPNGTKLSVSHSVIELTCQTSVTLHRKEVAELKGCVPLHRKEVAELKGCGQFALSPEYPIAADELSRSPLWHRGYSARRCEAHFSSRHPLTSFASLNSHLPVSHTDFRSSSKKYNQFFMSACLYVCLALNAWDEA